MPGDANRSVKINIARLEYTAERRSARGGPSARLRRGIRTRRSDMFRSVSCGRMTIPSGTQTARHPGILRLADSDVQEETCTAYLTRSIPKNTQCKHSPRKARCDHRRHRTNNAQLYTSEASREQSIAFPSDDERRPLGRSRRSSSVARCSNGRTTSGDRARSPLTLPHPAPPAAPRRRPCCSNGRCRRH